MSKPDDMLLIPRRKIEDAVTKLRDIDEFASTDAVLDIIHSLEVELERASYLQSKAAGKIGPLGDMIFGEI